MTETEAKAFIRKIMGPPYRELEEDEKEHMLLVLHLIEPLNSSNNQRSWTDSYVHADKLYEVTTFEDGSTVVHEYLEKKYDI